MKGLNLKPKHKAYIALGLTALAVGYLLYNRSKKKKQIKEIQDIIDGNKQDPSSGGAQKIIAKSDYDKLPDGKFPLAYGSKSKKVYQLQKALNVKYGTNIDLDGAFGISTANALCKHYFYWTCATGSDPITIKRVSPLKEEDYREITKLK